jgi:hypothetical protein
MIRRSSTIKPLSLDDSHDLSLIRLVRTRGSVPRKVHPSLANIRDPTTSVAFYNRGQNVSILHMSHLLRSTSPKMIGVFQAGYAHSNVSLPRMSPVSVLIIARLSEKSTGATCKSVKRYVPSLLKQLRGRTARRALEIVTRTSPSAGTPPSELFKNCRD